MGGTSAPRAGESIGQREAGREAAAAKKREELVLCVVMGRGSINRWGRRAAGRLSGHPWLGLPSPPYTVGEGRLVREGRLGWRPPQNGQPPQKRAATSASKGREGQPPRPQKNASGSEEGTAASEGTAARSEEGRLLGLLGRHLEAALGHDAAQVLRLGVAQPQDALHHRLLLGVRLLRGEEEGREVGGW